MIVTLKSCTLVGIDAELVDVECTIDRGLPQYSIEMSSAVLRATCRLDGMRDVDPTADRVSQVM